MHTKTAQIGRAAWYHVGQSATPSNDPALPKPTTSLLSEFPSNHAVDFVKTISEMVEQVQQPATGRRLARLVSLNRRLTP